MRCSITCTDDHAGGGDSGERWRLRRSLRAVEKAVRACRRRYGKSSNELKITVGPKLGEPARLRYPNAFGRVSTVPGAQAVWPVG
jgi:hypothetical protein